MHALDTVNVGAHTAMTDSVLERLRVYKQVCRKIRSSLVAGREEVVSPSTICRSFLDSYENMAPATSTDSGIFPGDARESPQLPFQSDCPFVEAADGWTVEYCEKRCEVRRIHLKQWATCPPCLCSPYLLLCLSVFFIFPPTHTPTAL